MKPFKTKYQSHVQETSSSNAKSSKVCSTLVGTFDTAENSCGKAITKTADLEWCWSGGLVDLNARRVQPSHSVEKHSCTSTALQFLRPGSEANFKCSRIAFSGGVLVGEIYDLDKFFYVQLSPTVWVRIYLFGGRF